MILNFCNKVTVIIDDELVTTTYADRFKVPSLNDCKSAYTLTVTAVDRMDTDHYVNVSVYMKYDKEDIVLCDKNGKNCQSLLGKFDQRNVTLTCERGYDYSELISYTIQPFLRYSLLKCDMALIHASSFQLDGSKVLVAAWAHTGKTAMLLSALKRGARYFGDDLSIVSAQGELYPYTVPINLFDYNLENNETLKAHLTTAQRVKMKTAQRIAKIFHIMQQFSKSSKMKYLFYAGKTFFEGSIHIALFPDQIFPGACDSPKGPIDNVILLERSQHLSHSQKNPCSLDRFAERLQHCINYEFQRFNEITTSAKWTPYYEGDKSLERREKDVYRRCFQKHNLVREIVAADQDFDELLSKLIETSEKPTNRLYTSNQVKPMTPDASLGDT